MGFGSGLGLGKAAKGPLSPYVQGRWTSLLVFQNFSFETAFIKPVTS
jgi:hypothetical protein